LSCLAREGGVLDEDVEFEATEFSVGDDEEVPTPACWVEHSDVSDAVVEAFEFLLVVLDALIFGSKFIEEEGTKKPEDVCLGGVVLAEFSAGFSTLDGLEQRAEHGRAD
jgi:hypothetical protein